MTVHTYKPEDICATFTTEDGRVIELVPYNATIELEPVGFERLEPTGPTHFTFECTVKHGGVWIYGYGVPFLYEDEACCERVYGHRGRRVVGRKIRQARRRMRRVMEGCL